MGASSTCAKAQKPSVLSETTRVTVNPDGHFCIFHSPTIGLSLSYRGFVLKPNGTYWKISILQDSQPKYI